MQQILQSLKNGKTILADIPCPSPGKGQLLIQTQYSLISPGTEKMLLSFGKANFLGKIKQQPDKVKMVIDKIKSDGLMTTLQTVLNKLDTPITLGYSQVGTVIAKGDDTEDFSLGDNVVSNGAHAEIVCVSKNLCAKVPSDVPSEEAVFTVLAAIALQGIRLANPTLGETFAVFGMGLIGLLTVQLLRNNGCHVIALDFNEERLALAETFGASCVNLSHEKNPILAVQQHVANGFVDGSLITAATDSDELMHQAAQICRQRGRIILVGVTGLHLRRSDFYEKELTFQVSCAYGPGRYDPLYEKFGQDYPKGFVRWTLNRNFEAILSLLSQKKLIISPLITKKYPFEEAISAYETLTENANALGFLLEYPQKNPEEKIKKTIFLNESTEHAAKNTNVSIGMIGTGAYASRFLLPALKNAPVKRLLTASKQGISAQQAAKKFDFKACTTDNEIIFNDSLINTVFIATQHNSHASLTARAIKHQKHVFVEKPLALSQEELNNIVSLYTNTNLKLMVGFNRRFAPAIKTIKNLLHQEKAPKIITMQINAGTIPASHWTQMAEIGGGRILGEVCHFIDLARFLIGYPVKTWQAMSMDKTSEHKDNLVITLKFNDESLVTIHYTANGSKQIPKERIEISTSGKSIYLDNYRRLITHGFYQKNKRYFKQDKGQTACVIAFIEAVAQDLNNPIPFDELIEVSQLTLDIHQALRG
jgi:predicted dehydrogenase/threonine dehydrogenase-like Zn-dependent dehydrogenase